MATPFEQCKLAIVITGGRVTIQPRAAAVWIEVES